MSQFEHFWEQYVQSMRKRGLGHPDVNAANAAREAWNAAVLAASMLIVHNSDPSDLRIKILNLLAK